MACFFRNAGKHEGPIGEVRNVFGKKKAKEECARLTVEYLGRVRDGRVEAGMRLVKGGGEGGKGREESVEMETEGEFVDCRE